MVGSPTPLWNCFVRCQYFGLQNIFYERVCVINPNFNLIDVFYQIILIYVKASELKLNDNIKSKLFLYKHFTNTTGNKF